MDIVSIAKVSSFFLSYVHLLVCLVGSFTLLMKSFFSSISFSFGAIINMHVIVKWNILCENLQIKYLHTCSLKFVMNGTATAQSSQIIWLLLHYPCYWCVKNYVKKKCSKKKYLFSVLRFGIVSLHRSVIRYLYPNNVNHLDRITSVNYKHILI